MNYKLRTGKKLEKDLRRIALRQMQRAGGLLRKGAGDDGETVHGARQWLKKARATLRLARPAMGEDAWKTEDRKLRKAGKELSQRRDAEVLVEAVEKLQKTHGKGVAAEVWEKLRGMFLERRQAAAGKYREALRKCEKAARRVEDWPVKELRQGDLFAGVENVFEDGRKAMAEAERTRQAAELHEWRKRVKELGYELRILEQWQPKKVAALRKGMKRLGKELGEDHDLELLQAAAAKSHRLDATALKAVSARVKSRRADLQRGAFELGRKLFEEKAAEWIKAGGQ